MVTGRSVRWNGSIEDPCRRIWWARWSGFQMPGGPRSAQDKLLIVSSEIGRLISPSNLNLHPVHRVRGGCQADHRRCMSPAASQPRVRGFPSWSPKTHPRFNLQARPPRLGKGCAAGRSEQPGSHGTGPTARRRVGSRLAWVYYSWSAVASIIDTSQVNQPRRARPIDSDRVNNALCRCGRHSGAGAQLRCTCET